MKKFKTAVVGAFALALAATCLAACDNDSDREELRAGNRIERRFFRIVASRCGSNVVCGKRERRRSESAGSAHVQRAYGGEFVYGESESEERRSRFRLFRADYVFGARGNARLGRGVRIARRRYRVRRQRLYFHA